MTETECYKCKSLYLTPLFLVLVSHIGSAGIGVVVINASNPVISNLKINNKLKMSILKGGFCYLIRLCSFCHVRVKPGGQLEPLGHLRRRDAEHAPVVKVVVLDSGVGF